MYLLLSVPFSNSIIIPNKPFLVVDASNHRGRTLSSNRKHLIQLDTHHNKCYSDIIIDDHHNNKNKNFKMNKQDKKKENRKWNIPTLCIRHSPIVIYYYYIFTALVLLLIII